MKANFPQPGRRPRASRHQTGVAAGWAALLGALLVSGCESVPAPPLVPTPAPPVVPTRPLPVPSSRQPSPAPSPPPAPMTTRLWPSPSTAAPVDWRDAPLAAGAWHWARESGLSTARFGPAGQSPTLALRCDRAAGQVVLRLAAASLASGPAAAQVSMTIITSTLTRPLVATAAANDGSGAPMLSAALPAHDPLLDAMIFSRGRFRIEAEGLPPLTVPSWPEVARVVEDCR